VQRMTLGSGALHSERNGSKTEPMRFLQFWILPDAPGLKPSLEQRQFTRDDRRNRLLQVVGPEGGDVLGVHQDATVHVASLDPRSEVEHRFGDERAGYLYVIGGAVELNGADTLRKGDAFKVYGPETIRLEAAEPTDLILIEVPARYTPVGVWAR
jgi:redox-sensitive bicupin YhaK (pirin superfamily)